MTDDNDCDRPHGIFIAVEVEDTPLKVRRKIHWTMNTLFVLLFCLGYFLASITLAMQPPWWVTAVPLICGIMAISVVSFKLRPR